jgi:very-short-patch-repair endonuclease
MAKLMGFDLLKKQTIDIVQEAFAEIDDWVRGDSEIERLFDAALHYRIAFGSTEYSSVAIAQDPDNAEQLRQIDRSRDTLIVESQVKIGEYRVDFVISAWTYGSVWSEGAPPVHGSPRWRKLVVECDGHDYHERTKEQAASDRSRDRQLNASGYDVFRFTGSELWRDPWGCAEQVYQWAARGI